MLEDQQTIAIFAALLLLILFLSVITLLRLRSSKRLKEKNLELKQKNDMLVLANKRAEESSRMKTDFIQQISHEIRTPLNILSGFTQVLTTPNVKLSDAERHDINQRITDNTNRITELVNKMLELSSMHSQSVIERTDETTAVQIAALAAQESGIQQATNFTFNLHFDEANDKPIKTNLHSASRVLTLLLDNAKKFTKKGRVDLEVSYDEVNSMVIYTITDTGIGIPAYESERIFQEFTQLDQYYDGTGIGLTVARSIARRLGGDIHLDTSYNNGARFIYTLPYNI